MADEVVLDRRTFEALAEETRVKILKALAQRRKMPSELSHELHLAVSTVSEHLDKMHDAGLVSRRRQGKKWVYYELTEKGQHILSPKKTSVFVFALSVSLFMLAAGALGLLTGPGTYAGASPASIYTENKNQDMITAGSPVADNLTANAAIEQGNATPDSLEKAAALKDPLSVILLIGGVFTLIMSVAWWNKK